MDVAVEVEIGVRRDYAPETRPVEHAVHLGAGLVRIGGRRRAREQTLHRPHVEHRGRRYQFAVRPGSGRVRIGVERVSSAFASHQLRIVDTLTGSRAGCGVPARPTSARSSARNASASSGIADSERGSASAVTAANDSRLVRFLTRRQMCRAHRVGESSEDLWSPDDHRWTDRTDRGHTAPDPGAEHDVRVSLGGRGRTRRSAQGGAGVR